MQKDYTRKDCIFCFFLILWFFKRFKMVSMTIHREVSIFLELRMVLWYNHYLYTLMIFANFLGVNYHTCSLNLNYFRDIYINSFKWAKTGRKLENSYYLGFIHLIRYTLCGNYSGIILNHILCTCYMEWKCCLYGDYP